MARSIRSPIFLGLFGFDGMHVSHGSFAVLIDSGGNQHDRSSPSDVASSRSQDFVTLLEKAVSRK